ncbi:MAG: hypothetical protein P4M09_14725 [Devosia sp.]|nr:hypothetical protein [Devosia sp.]
MAAAADTPDQVAGAFNGAAQLLAFGPLGLAAIFLIGSFLIMLVPVDLQANKAQTLKQFQIIGAICFVLALIVAFLQNFLGASHLMTLLLIPPQNEGGLPNPTIQVQNGKIIPYGVPFPVAADVTVIVDVGPAATKYSQTAATASSLAQKVAGSEAELNSYANQVQVQKTSLKAASDQLAAQNAKLVDLTKSFTDIKAEIAKAPTTFDPNLMVMTNKFETLLYQAHTPNVYTNG